MKLLNNDFEKCLIYEKNVLMWTNKKI